MQVEVSNGGFLYYGHESPLSALPFDITTTDEPSGSRGTGQARQAHLCLFPISLVIYASGMCDGPGTAGDGRARQLRQTRFYGSRLWGWVSACSQWEKTCRTG